MRLLNELLDSGAQFDPHYLPSFNSDHLPMALVALAQLGGQDAVLADFATRYQQRLRPVIDGPEVANVAAGRGNVEAFESVRRLIRQEISGAGPAMVIAKYLPGLLPSIPTGAFHPIIRLGFAIKAKHEGEIASALSYWLTQPFNPELGPPSEARSLKSALQEQGAMDLPPGRFSEGLNRLSDMGRYPTPVATTLQECASTSLEVYLGTRNFFALHFVTATQAARLCLPYVVEADLVAALTAGIQAGYLVVGAPDFDQPLPIPGVLDEEHGIKYAYACLEEYRHYGDERYRAEFVGFVQAGLVPEWALNAL